MTVRTTQSAVIVGVQNDNVPVRTTQAAVLVGVKEAQPVRTTQAAVLVGVKVLKGLCVTNDCDLWRITRTDGEVFRFTSHNRRVTYKGAVYSPCNSLTPSAVQTSAEIGSVDNMDLSGMITDDAITEADLYAGKFDNATVEVFRADWKTGEGFLIAAGRCGRLSFENSRFTFEVVTATERMNQTPILSPVMPTCRFKFGDDRCTVDVAALAETGTVTGVPDLDIYTQSRRRAFEDTSRGEAANYWQFGRLTWTTGDNAGQAVDVKAFSSGGGFILATATNLPIQVGDTYSVIPGCARTEAACASFANSVNFGGFPHVRGEDDLSRRAPVK